jgi:hypothetical protein
LGKNNSPEISQICFLNWILELNPFGPPWNWNLIQFQWSTRIPAKTY